MLRFKPGLDPAISRLQFSVYYDRRWIDVSIVGEDVTLTSEFTSRPPVTVACRGQEAVLGSGETREFLRSP